MLYIKVHAKKIKIKINKVCYFDLRRKRKEKRGKTQLTYTYRTNQIRIRVLII